MAMAIQSLVASVLLLAFAVCAFGSQLDSAGQPKLASSPSADTIDARGACAKGILSYNNGAGNATVVFFANGTAFSEGYVWTYRMTAGYIAWNYTTYPTTIYIGNTTTTGSAVSAFGVATLQHTDCWKWQLFAPNLQNCLPSCAPASRAQTAVRLASNARPVATVAPAAAINVYPDACASGTLWYGANLGSATPVYLFRNGTGLVPSLPDDPLLFSVSSTNIYWTFKVVSDAAYIGALRPAGSRSSYTAQGNAFFGFGSNYTSCWPFALQVPNLANCSVCQ